MLVDPFEMVKQLQPGLMIFGRGGESMDKMNFVFLIREEEKYIKRLGYNPIIQVRLGFFNIDGITPSMMMIRFNNDPDMTYDGWLNYYDMYEEGKLNTSLLQTQDKLIFSFYNSDECKRTVGITNNLKSHFNRLPDMIKDPWSMEEFNRVKEKIYDMYDPSELWNALEFKN